MRLKMEHMCMDCFWKQRIGMGIILKNNSWRSLRKSFQLFTSKYEFIEALKCFHSLNWCFFLSISKPILQNDLDHRDRFKCPVYQTSEQRKMHENIEIYENCSIMTVLLPTGDQMHGNFWIKRGVVLVCQPEDWYFENRSTWVIETYRQTTPWKIRRRKI